MSDYTQENRSYPFSCFTAPMLAMSGISLSNNAICGDANDHKRSLPILGMLEPAEARKLTWLKEGSSAIQQQALRDLNQAFQNWWKRPDHFGRPTWHKAGINEGFVIRDLSVRRINRRWGQVFVPKCGWVKFRVTREWSDIETASSARVTLDRSGRWFVSFTRRNYSGHHRESVG